MSLELRVVRDPITDRVGFLVMDRRRDGIAIGEPVKLRELSEEEWAVQNLPTFNLSMAESQALMDRLWDAGLRPSEGSGSAGALAATQRHLEDLRKLVGHALKLKEKL